METTYATFSIAVRNSSNISATVRSDEFCTNVCDLAVWPFDRLTSVSLSDGPFEAPWWLQHDQCQDERDEGEGVRCEGLGGLVIAGA